MGKRGKIMKKLVYPLIIVIIFISTTALAKRHSKTKKREHVEHSAPTSNKLLREALNKQTKDMTFAQAQLAKEYYTTHRDEDMIVKCSQRLLAVGGDQETMRITRLELAEIFLTKKNYKDAEKYAQEYQKYYPGAKEITRAEYIAIEANYLSKLSSDRDQEQANRAINLAKEFLEKHPDEKEYTPKIKEMMRKCYKSLIRHEINVIHTQLNTYRNTKKEMVLTAAEKRLAHAKEKYLPSVPEAQQRLDEVGLLLAQAHPNYTPKKQEPLLLAQSQEPKKGWFDSIKSRFVEDNDAYFA